MKQHPHIAVRLTMLALLVPSQIEAESRDSALGKGEAWFSEEAVEMGVDFDHVRSGTVHFWLPEIMSGGAAWIDYDGDGDLDLYLVQGGAVDASGPVGPGNRLYRRESEGRYVDVTEAAGVGDTSYGMGASVGDIDGDGALDLYVTNLGPNSLLRNRGDGTFEDVTLQAGVGDASWSSSSAFVDFDRDGDLDLFVVNYIQWSPSQEIECFGAGGQRDYCHPSKYQAPAPDRLYENDGAGHFLDVTEEAGLQSVFGAGLGITIADFDRDGALDIYVANDGMPNQLWHNQGDGTFIDQALLLGTALNRRGEVEASMGVVAGDPNHDGEPDLWVTHLRQETNTFYLNRDGFFKDATVKLGLAAPSLPWTGFGTGLVDFDHDGQLDLFVANGRVGIGSPAGAGSGPFAEPNQLFRGLNDGGFELLIDDSISQPFRVENSRAAAFGDLDLDGDVDLAVVNNGGKARLLVNRRGDSRPWLRIKLWPQIAALGTSVELTTAGSTQWRQIQPAYGYCTSNESAAHFGLGSGKKIESLHLIFPNGRRLRFTDLQAEHVYLIAAGPIH